MVLSTSQLLQNHYDEIKGHANVKNTIISVSQRHAALRARLQEAEGGAMFAGVVGNVVSPLVPRSWSGAGIVGVRGVRGGSERGGAAGGAGVSAAVADMLDFGGGGRDEAG